MTLDIPSEVGRCLSLASENAHFEELKLITQIFCDVRTRLLQGKHAHCRQRAYGALLAIPLAAGKRAPFDPGLTRLSALMQPYGAIAATMCDSHRLEFRVSALMQPYGSGAATMYVRLRDARV